jgi:hypothetical protein
LYTKISLDDDKKKLLLFAFYYSAEQREIKSRPCAQPTGKPNEYLTILYLFGQAGHLDRKRGTPSAEKKGARKYFHDELLMMRERGFLVSC